MGYRYFQVNLWFMFFSGLKKLLSIVYLLQSLPRVILFFCRQKKYAKKPAAALLAFNVSRLAWPLPAATNEAEER
jgi:hypothetical protein